MRDSVRTCCWAAVLTVFLFSQGIFAQVRESNEAAILNAMHSISSRTLYEYVKVLSSKEFAGRLTGTEGFDEAAAWTAGQLNSFSVKPLGGEGTYLQKFPQHYTQLLKGSEAYLHIPYKDVEIKKYYHFDHEFIPGGTSASGQLTAEVVYCGYGITAKELGYDDYAGVNVKGKIVLIEPEIPVSTKDPGLFKKWRPYSFHQYKLENAVKHGAKGMLYNYGPIGNPNNSYDPGFVYHHVGSVVTDDIFAGTGKNHADVKKTIQKILKPQSFYTEKIFTIKNNTVYHPDATGANVIGLYAGTDETLNGEYIMLSAHLDHLGYAPELMPGANDNASGVAVLLGIARALNTCTVKPKRSVVFALFGAEEQAVRGSEYYLDHPAVPLAKTLCLINLDGIGCGTRFSALAGKNFPAFWDYIDRANSRYIHREIWTAYFANLARPRLDAARFLWAGVPSISLSAFGTPSEYHNTRDTIDLITPEILEDAAQLLFVAVLDMANAESVDFRN